MIKPELYERTVGILVDAYFNDTLEHGNCYACAVGNIVAANCGYQFEINISNKPNCTNKNGDLVYTGNGRLFWNKDNNFYDNITRALTESKEELIGDDTRKQLASTSYSFAELYKIEKAFESKANINPQYKDAAMFEGLMAVVDCLDEIHENKDTSVTAETKQRFNKAIAV